MAIVFWMSPAAFASVSVHAPGTAVLGSRISVTVTGLKPGHYTLVISRVAGPTQCLALIAAGDATHGTLKLSGTLPRRLLCYLGRQPSFGSVAFTTGGYFLSIGQLVPPTSFASSASFVKTRIRIVA